MTVTLLEQVKQAGVVGAGGAGFPTHIKLNAKVEYVIVNGAECEPLLRVDQQLMSIYACELWQALKPVVEHTGANRGFVALKKKYETSIKSLQQNVLNDKKYSIFQLEDFYPAGDEQVLVYEVTGRIVPEGGIPLNVGCVVVNVETLLNVWWAVQGVPVTQKYVTITGAVRKPLSVQVPVGTKIKSLIELAGGSSVESFKIIDGGPMMGKIVSIDDVVTKTTGGVILLPEQHPLILHKEQSLQVSLLRAKAACCQCRACTDVCPRYLLGHDLEPHKIMRILGSNYMGTEITNAFLCSECGVCDKYGCPMGLSPRMVNAMLKKELSEAGIRNPHLRKELTVDIMRSGRKIPIKRLIARLGLEEYDLPAPLIEVEFTPKEVKIPLAQHIGKPSVPIVKVGEKVEKGQLIGVIPKVNDVGANIHASLTGIVETVGDSIIIRRL